MLSSYFIMIHSCHRCTGSQGPSNSRNISVVDFFSFQIGNHEIFGNNILDLNSGETSLFLFCCCWKPIKITHLSTHNHFELSANQIFQLGFGKIPQRTNEQTNYVRVSHANVCAAEITKKKCDPSERLTAIFWVFLLVLLALVIPFFGCFDTRKEFWARSK